ncbi:uncharacterized protein LOC133885378 [Phragmites australis]|uniref:uncharacterized protein LOC133885378 n=1 Tax=Phragmites australis TaxID=29695 RepID=UPI002D79DCB8|nr:uncharacterized protein LOC133885378 [Phragmites australis]XP_062181072.1 uncharacterized protein LOC133885378 [Phragmites australis]
MSGFAGQRSRPWVEMAGAATPSEPAVAGNAAAASSMNGAGALGTAASTSASAISFGFAATAVLVSMFLLMAIFEHLIKPGLASSPSPGSRDDDGAGSGHGLPPVRRQPHDASPDKPSHSPEVEPVVAAADLTVLMPGQRYPTFLAQPAPLLPCHREGVHWPPHAHRHSFVPP